MKKRHAIEKDSSRSVIEVLEPRLLYSATIDVVLVDSALSDQDMLAAAHDADYYYVFDSANDSAADIVAKISQWSRDNQAPIDSLSIISHGSSGSFELGSDTVTASSISAQSDVWKQLGDALAADANIYLYGCEVGADGAGQALLNQLADATDADVFASDDLTGANGDWELEVASEGDEQELNSGLTMPMSAPLLKGFSATLTSTGFHNPSAASGNWNGQLQDGTTTTNPAFAYTNDQNRIAPGDDKTEQFYNYGFNVTAGAAINGIEIVIDAYKPDTYYLLNAQYGPSDLVVSLSWDGGTSWTATKSLTWQPNASNNEVDVQKTYGSASDTWGRTWTASELSNANFRVRIFHDSDPAFATADGIEVDWVGARVEYNERPTTTGLSAQNLQEDFTSYTIDLKTLFADLETSDANLVYSASGNNNIGVSIDANGIATISASTANWNGVENITFTAEDQGGLTVSTTAAFTVAAVNDAPVLTGDLTATMNEGATYTLQLADLGYTDVDDAATGVTFSISNELNGRIQVNGVNASSFTGTQLAAGQVTFIHDGTETTAAAFDVFVEDGNEDSSVPVNSTFNFTVTPVNDAPVLTGDLSATLSEGSTYTLQAADLGYTDIDDVDAGVTFSISNAVNGRIQVNGVDASSFTVAQLAAGLVTFIHDGSETTTAAFNVNVEDGNEDGSVPVNSTFNFTVTAVNDAPVLMGDLSATLDEGSTYTLQTADLGYTDADDVAAAVTFSISNESNGRIQVNGVDASSFTGAQLAAGQVTFIHDGSETIAAAFDVIVEDGNEDNSAPVSSTFNFTITPVNDAPVLTGDLSATLNEGSTYTLQAADLGYTDVDDTAAGVTFSISNESNGRIQVNGVDASSFTGAQLAAGQVTFVHDGSETITAAFDVTVDDGNEDGSAPVSSTFNFTVTPVNDAPVADNDTLLNGPEDTASAVLNTGMLAGDTDADGDALTITHINGVALTGGVQTIAVTNGTVNIAANNDITFTPGANYVGAVSFTYTVSDGNGGTSTATVSGTITNVNDAPVADNDTLLNGLEDTASAVLNTGMLTGDTDVDGDTLTITHINGVALTGGVQTIAITNGTVNIAANNDITFTPSTDYVGAVSFTYTVSDGNGGTSTATVSGTITNVNDAPVADNDTLLNGLEDTASAVLNTGMLAGDTDIDGDTLAITHINGVALTGGVQAIAVANGTVNIAANNDITFTPGANYVGAVSFTYTVSDGNGGTSTATVSGTITNVNDAPVADNDTLLDGLEDTASAVLNTGMLAGDTDIDGDTLTITHINGVALTGGVQAIAVANGTVNIAANNDITFIPGANYVGAVSFTYTVNDGNGGTSTATVSGTVTAVNDAPVLTGDLSATLNEGSTYTLQAADLGYTDVDDTAAGVTFSISNESNGRIQVNGVDASSFTGAQLAAGQVTFVHDGSETITAAFDVTVDDGNEDGSAPVSSTFNFTVTPVNDAPVADNDTLLNGLEDTASAVLNTGMLAGDTDADGDALTITHINGVALTGGVQTIAVTNGTVNIAANNDITFTPSTDYVGAVSFTYTISDGSGGTSTATVSGSITNVNDAPVADNDTLLNGLEDTASAVLNTGMLTGDTDIDGDTLAITHINGVALTGGVQTIAVANGTVNIAANNDITFTPSTDYVGAVSFTYTVSDGNGGTSIATVSGTITNVNDAPVADNDTLLNGLEDTASAVLNTGMLAGDTDIDGDTLAITHINGVALTGGVQTIAVTNGTVNIAANNDITFTPSTDYAGAVSFTYTVSDGNGGTSTATVSGTVTAVNDAPVLTGDLSATLNEGSTYTLQLADLGYTDVDDTASGVTFSISNESNGRIQVNGVNSSSFTGTQLAAGQVTFIHDGSETITAAFDVIVEDGNEDNSAPVISTFNFTITPVNDAPVLTGDLSATLNEGSTYTLQAADLGYTDVDDAAAGVTFSISNESNGRIQVNGVDASSFTGAQLAAGQVTFVHDGSETIAAAFDVTVDDGNEDGSAPVSSTFNFTVTPANDAPVADNDTLLNGLEDTASAVLNTGMLAGDTDADGDALTITHINGVALTGGVQTIAVTNGTVNIAANNDITFTPSTDYAGAVSFTYTISDGSGGTSIATVSGTITDVNDAPTNAGFPDQNLVEGFKKYTIDLSALFSDVETASHQLVFSVQGNSNIHVVVDDRGIATISSNTGWTGTERITITAMDENGLTSTASANFIVSPAPFSVPGGTPELPEENSQEETTNTDDPSGVVPDKDTPNHSVDQDANNQPQPSDTSTKPTDSADSSLILRDFFGDQPRVISGIVSLREANDTYKYLDRMEASAAQGAVSGIDWLKARFSELQNKDASEGISFEETEFYSANKWLLDKSRGSDQDLRKDVESENIVVRIAEIAAGITMTIAGLWIGRAAAFGSSLFAAIPAWRSLDPIAVLNKKKEQKRKNGEDEDDSEVENLFSDKP